MCDVDIAQYDDRTIKCEEKNNGPTEYDKSTIIYHVLLLNVTMELSNMRKKIRGPPNLTKVWSDVILILPNVMVELSNVRKKIMEN